MSEKINLQQELDAFVGEYWQSKIVGQFNGHDLMIVKVKGEYRWHKHNDTDDFFLCIKGQVTIQLRERNVTLNPGDLYVVPEGVEHCPLAAEEAHILLIEPKNMSDSVGSEKAAVKVDL